MPPQGNTYGPLVLEREFIVRKAAGQRQHITPLQPPGRRVRGRPTGPDRHLSDDLLRAAERGLSTKSPDELTRQEIAELAGTNSAMISYYFASKEGLFRALLDELMKDMRQRIAALDASLTARSTDPTRRIIEGLMNAYAANQGACRILAVELTKEQSTIKDAYIARDASLVTEQIATMLDRLVSIGVYDGAADVPRIAATIRLFVTHPLFGPPAWTLLETADEDAGRAAWIAHVVTLLNHSLRPGNRMTASQETPQ